jgi:hemoglobin-like flavoprotein
MVSLQVELLEESFDLVVLRGDELTEGLYRRLFAVDPALRALFVNAVMEVQKIKLISTLIVLRKSLRDLEAIRPELRALGAHHRAYGVLPEHYALLGAALIQSMAEIGGEHWKPEYTAAWSDAYQLVQDIMLQGAAAVDAGEAQTADPSPSC